MSIVFEFINFFLQYSSISGEMHPSSFILKEKHSPVNGNHGSHELCSPGGFILLDRILGETPSSKSFPFMMDTADRTCPSTSTRSRPLDPTHSIYTRSTGLQTERRFRHCPCGHGWAWRWYSFTASSVPTVQTTL